MNTPNICRGTRRVPAAVALALLLLAAILPFARSAEAQAGFERGPDPTIASLQAPLGPFAVTTRSLRDSATPGFGAATIYYPSATAEGPFGAVAVAPGFTAGRGPISELAERVASHGFVVINIDTNSRFDFPESRGNQLRAALQFVAEASPVSSIVDGSRTAVMGHSMGGGGALEAIVADPSIDAALPLSPWNTDKTWPEVTTPTMIIAAESDGVAPNGRHSIPFYNSMGSALDKAYLELNNATHGATDANSPTVGLHAVAWLKRHVDNDLRYAQFLCPGPSASAAVSDYRATCPSAVLPTPTPTPAPPRPAPTPPRPTPPPGVALACEADAGTVTWNDAGQSKYWVYRSTDGGNSFSWIGRTLGGTSFTDQRPQTGARYQLHFAAAPRFNCATITEPSESFPDPACFVDRSRIFWTDQQQDRYWIYRSIDGGSTWTWLGRTLGATTFVDQEPVANGTYQLRYPAAQAVPCFPGD